MNTHNISTLLKFTEQYSFNSHNIHKLISSEYFETKATKKKLITQKSYKKNDDFLYLVKMIVYFGVGLF